MKNIYLSDLKIALRRAMRHARKENDEVAQGVDDVLHALADQLEMSRSEREAFAEFICKLD